MVPSRRLRLASTLPLCLVAVLSAHAQTQSQAPQVQSPPTPATSTPAQAAPTPAQAPAAVPAPAVQPEPFQSVPAPTKATEPLPALSGYQPAQKVKDRDLPPPTPRAPNAPETVTPTPVPHAVPTPTPTVQANMPSFEAYDPEPFHPAPDTLSSTYIPVDSPIYPMALRLYSMGYLDSAFISMRPWTRRSLLHMLEKTEPALRLSNDDEAREILVKLQAMISSEGPTTPEGAVLSRGSIYGVESVYTRLMGIAGPTLRDSFHVGTSLQNDYGRPYGTGFNGLLGFSSVNEMGRFSLYVRGEYQRAPSRTDYSLATAQTLTFYDEVALTTPTANPTLPVGTTPAQNPFRLQEATLSFHLLNHEISAGKSDAWLGPGLGGAMAWSNNAEDIYSFRINRVEPLRIPLLHYLLGPVRYDFFVGSLKGHAQPNDPWIHSEMVAFRPSKNFEFGFQRSVIWGGHGHGCLVPGGSINAVYNCNEPVTLHTFLKSFFSLNDTNIYQKYSREDPGARFSSFTFSYRLPFVRNWLTLYSDSETHDDAFPISAPRRAGIRPGLYLSHFPGAPRLDLRVEAANTNADAGNNIGGGANYYEVVQRNGYTNKQFILGDWIGREAKGGQAWLTYHLSGNEWAQVSWLTKKSANDFIPGGTTQNQFRAELLKRIRPDIELDAWVQVERWKAPVYKPGQQNDTTAAFQVTFFPRLRTPGGLAGH